MKAYYKITESGYSVGNKSREGFTEYDTNNVPAELQALFDAENEAQVITHFKQLYLEIFKAKLKELDYDSIATVHLWLDDATFGTEATKIMIWYKALITKNYEILNVAKVNKTIPTDEEFIAMLPVFIGQQNEVH